MRLVVERLQKTSLRRSLRCLLWLLILALSQTASPSALLSAEDPLDDYKLAVGLYNKSRWKLAVESFESFLKKNPQHRKAENARYYLGLTFVNLEDYKQARDVLREFLKLHPKSRDAAQATFWVGQCSYMLDDYPAAETELAAFIQKAPDDPLLERALPYLGDIELRLHKPEAAAKSFSQVLKAYPKGSMTEDAQFGLARSYEGLKRIPEAIQLYRTLASNRTGTRAAEAQLKLASRYFDDGNFAASVEEFDRLEKQFPESPFVTLARLNHGFASYQQGDYPKAITYFDKASLDPKYTAEALLWKGLSLKQLGDIPQAIAVLKGAFEKFNTQPIAETILYQWALCEMRQNAFDKARALFVDLVARWPKGTFASESLHAAALAALSSGNLPETEALLARFDREYPLNKLRYRKQILQARLALAKDDPAGAVKLLQGVIAESDLEATKAQARYYLAAAAQKQGNHLQVLEVTEPLVAQIDADKSLAEFNSIYVVRAASSLALGKVTGKDKLADRTAYFTASTAAAQKYLTQIPQGDLVDQALAIKILAAAHSASKVAAQTDLQTLRTKYPNTPELERTLFELGEIAADNKDWEWAETLFAELAAKSKESKYHARALRELGYAQSERKRFGEASATFAKLMTDHPESEFVPEAAFRRARALQDLDRLPDALKLFTEAFQKYGKTDAGYLSGLQRARLQAKLKKPVEADAAYDELLKHFPNGADTESLLNEWALTNHEAEQYARADEIFRRLVREFPNGKAAGSARLSLAESDLVNGKIDEARKQFVVLATAPQADPETQQQVQQRSLYQLMLIELELKRWEDLRKACTESLKRFPEGTYHADAEFHFAEADFQLHAYKEAQTKLVALKAHKDNADYKQATWFPRVWVMLAETELRLKQFDAIPRIATDFRAWDPKSPLLYQVDEVLGRALKAQAKFPEAREVFETVIQDSNGRLTETAAQSQFYIAETYMLEKNYQKALLAYSKVEIRYKFPEWQAPALFQVGACQEALNEWKDATRTYENLLRDYPTSEFAAKAKERLEIARRKAAG